MTLCTDGLPAVEDLARFSLARQHARTRGWVDDTRRLAALTREHSIDIELASDPGLATMRRDRFAAGQPIELMLNRWVPAGDDLHAMISMRWEGGDPEFPFVDASPLSRPIASASELSAIAEAAQAAFGLLKPRYVRLWSADPPQHWPGTLPDKRFLAAPTPELTDRATPSELALVRASDLAHYDEARDAYDAVAAAHPHHRRQATVQSQDDLSETCRAGLLFDVVVDHCWVGYVAAKLAEPLGLPGHTVQELILKPTARGRRLGAHLTTLLARALPTTILVGTIHHDNRGASDAALNAGRHDVGGWWQVPLHSSRDDGRRAQSQLR